MYETFYNTIAYVPKLIDDDDKETRNQIAQFIDNLHAFGWVKRVTVTEYDPDERYSPDTLFVAIGGDGTMLYTARAAAKHGGTVIGFNFGSIGFLTDHNGRKPFFPGSYGLLGADYIYETFMTSMDAEEELDHQNKGMPVELIDNHYDILTAIQEYDDTLVELDRRSMIQVTDGNESYVALNEVFLSQQEIGSPFTWEIEINGQLTAKQTGSGVLVATPTGSTAMAMSAGGAIVHPTARTMEIVPVTPVTLTSRPIIASGLNDVIRLRSRPTQRNKSGLSLVIDGQVVKHLDPDDELCDIDVYVQNSQLEADIWHKKGWNFFDVLSRKFGWDQ